MWTFRWMCGHIREIRLGMRMSKTMWEWPPWRTKRKARLRCIGPKKRKMRKRPSKKV